MCMIFFTLFDAACEQLIELWDADNEALGTVEGIFFFTVIDPLAY